MVGVGAMIGIDITLLTLDMRLAKQNKDARLLGGEDST
jgi:hypothetical protein